MNTYYFCKSVIIISFFSARKTVCRGNTNPRPKQGKSPGLDLFSLKSGIQFSMTSEITRQMIHQARNSAGVVLCASQRTVHSLSQAVTFSVWQEQERKIRRSGFLLWVWRTSFCSILLGKYVSNYAFGGTK